MIKIKFVNFLIAYLNTPFVQGVALEDSVEGKASKGLLALFLLFLIPALVVLFFVIRFIYRHTIGKKLKTTLIEDYQKEAEVFEKAGSYVSAASIYEKKLKDYHKAALLYEKGENYNQAAVLYDVLRMSSKAKEMYEKAGSPEDAAEVALLDGELDEAATLYDRAGKKIDVANIMLQSGKTIYAVKAYREAGEYKKAAMLLKSEGMLKEAADMFQIYLYDKQPERSTLDDFYTFALVLEKIGNVEKAVKVLQEIEQVDSAFKDVHQRIETLMPPEEIPEGKTSLRSFMQNGRIESRYSLKLWIQMLKSLQEAYQNGWPFGIVSPDNIVIDARNNISFLKRKQSLVYSPPETTKGVALDERADIYSAGAILYEMLVGSLEHLGTERVIDIVEDVPDWLDEIVIRCIRKVRDDRYQSIKDIFTDLKALSTGAKDSGN